MIKQGRDCNAQFIMATAKPQADGRKNNKGVTKPSEEKKVPLTFHVKAKNKERIRNKFEALIKKEDK